MIFDGLGVMIACVFILFSAAFGACALLLLRNSRPVFAVMVWCLCVLAMWMGLVGLHDSLWA